MFIFAQAHHRVKVTKDHTVEPKDGAHVGAGGDGHYRGGGAGGGGGEHSCCSVLYMLRNSYGCTVTRAAD